MTRKKIDQPLAAGDDAHKRRRPHNTAQPVARKPPGSQAFSESAGSGGFDCVVRSFAQSLRHNKEGDHVVHMAHKTNGHAVE